MFNQTIFFGPVMRGPLRSAGSSKVVDISIPIDHSYFDKKTNQEVTKPTRWQRVECWNSLAEFVDRNFPIREKGSTEPLRWGMIICELDEPNEYSANGTQVVQPRYRGLSVQPGPRVGGQGISAVNPASNGVASGANRSAPASSGGSIEDEDIPF